MKEELIKIRTLINEYLRLEELKESVEKSKTIMFHDFDTINPDHIKPTTDAINSQNMLPEFLETTKSYIYTAIDDYKNEIELQLKELGIKLPKNENTTTATN